MDIAHRLGKSKDGYVRPIIVKFVSRQKRNKVIGGRKVFKDTNTFINEDLTMLNQSVMMMIKKAVSKPASVWSWDGKIFHKNSNDTVRQIHFREYKQWAGTEWAKLLAKYQATI
ncbi:hypothetical protein DPMN_176944 [Dreissena polymorpha]|uniref:Uncharacterized protein n=1 Tax=Dreissena polymorpha TaxID=45954 RepID=A0A9D4EAC3_DREPO|nr:hypothetical protein DPMN_176944 [Dreissena polymorpha]